MVKRNPEQTREQILAAATAEFAENGFGGARVDAVARRAGANKRMLYHYFGNKEGLFRAVLENAYARIRSHERDLKLENLDPATAIRQLVAFTFQYFVDNPEFIRLLNNENLFKAVHIKNSDKVRELHFPLVGQIAQVLDHGARDGVFRKGVDPVQLYVTIAAVGYFYLSNADTLGTIFGRDLLAREALDERLGHCQEVVLGYLRP